MRTSAATSPPQRRGYTSLQHRRPAPKPAGTQATRTQARAAPLERIIGDFAGMGFQRHQVVDVVEQLQSAGQPVDLNVILDTLTGLDR
jgi:hypothetical protein